MLPAQNLGVTLTVSNNSATAAADVTVSESFAGLVPPAATADIGTLPAASSRTRTFGATIPALPSRREGESSQDYQKRLGAADGTLYSALGLVSFKDATGRASRPSPSPRPVNFNSRVWP